MQTPSFDLIVIGGGIVGLATALESAQRRPGLSILILEKDDIAAHQSGRNSGVIHSGLYYAPGSLKARLCVAGAAAMLQFCRRHGLPHRVCGKLVVAATEAEIPRLKELHRRGVANGVAGLRWLTPAAMRELEPHCGGVAALHVPGAAITDFAAVTRTLAALLQEAGGQVRTRTRVLALRRSYGENVVETTAGAFRARLVVNAAGLHSDRIARMAGDQPGVRIIPFRGEYYSLVPERCHLVRSLIYPVPDPAFPFLGVHFTPRVQGGVEAGPNAVPAFAREGYRWRDVGLRDLAATFTFPGFWRLAARYWPAGLAEMYRSLRKQAFVRALQRLVPEVRASDLLPGGAGVRAQAVDRQGRLVDDFCILHAPGRVHVLNSPSPAATASLLIGQTIADTVAERLAAG